MKLLSFKPSDKEDKKYMVVLETNEGRKKTIHFGSKGADDFTITKNEEQKQRYINRHKAREDWSESGILTAGFWSYRVLWGPTTSISKNLELVKKQFNL